MKRRSATAVAIAMFAAFADRAASQTQGLQAPARVGILLSESVPMQAARLQALRIGLRELGHVEGFSIVFEVRAADGHYERLPELAAELVSLNVNVVVAFGIKALVAASQVTRKVPIVVPATSGDLVTMGLIQSLARPGGNVTGSTTFGPEIMAKRLELLKEARPRTQRAGVLVNSANSGVETSGRLIEIAAKSLRIEVESFPVRRATEFEPALDAMLRRRIEAMVVQDDTLFAGENAVRLARLAHQRGLASIGGVGFATSGGLLGYGRSDAVLYRRGAFFVDRILRGARPADLPVEQATQFELVINAGSAKALRIEIPPAVQVRADRIVG
ncbi:MAG: ABC transporter substrate-binding protein [Burkholderiaceae bacterium]